MTQWRPMAQRTEQRRRIHSGRQCANSWASYYGYRVRHRLRTPVPLAKGDSALVPTNFPGDLARTARGHVNGVTSRDALHQRSEQWKADLRAERQAARLLLRRLVAPLALCNAGEPSAEWIEAKRLKASLE